MTASQADVPAAGRSQSVRREALIQALALSVSVFVAGSSIFVAILALVAGVHQNDPIGLAQGERTPDSAARWWAFGLAAAVMVNGVVAGARGRKNNYIAAFCAAVFVAIVVATSALYLATW